MDRIAQDLARQGFTVTQKTFVRDDMEGWGLTVRGMEIVYRLDPQDDQTVLICNIRRQGPQNIRSSFKDLIWFVKYLAENRQRLDIRRVKGMIQADEDSVENALSARRILQFYTRYFSVYSAGSDLCGEWIALDLADFQEPRKKRSDHPPRS